jgi:hypothetical protein
MKTQNKVLDSFEVVAEIITAHQEISHFHILDVPSPPLLQERLPSDLVDPIILREALNLKEHYGVCFWDAYFVSLRDNPANMMETFSAALLHDSSAQRLRRIESKDVRSLPKLEHSMGTGQMLAISSRVELRNGESRHIPMLDLHPVASPANLTVATAAIRALNLSGPGFLLQSGKSYHYYGVSLLTERELVGFLARALLLGPIIDTRWVAHQILEGACALRIGSRRGYQNLPFVVAELP